MTPPSDRPAQTSWRILIVEDEPLISGTVDRMLQQLGHVTIIAEDGVTAVHLARIERPDLVLLDVNMPGRNGFDVLEQIKHDSEISNVAVIMLTGQRSEGNVIAGLRHADDYICKPFSMGELVARLNAVMRRVGQNKRD